MGCRRGPLALLAGAETACSERQGWCVTQGKCVCVCLCVEGLRGGEACWCVRRVGWGVWGTRLAPVQTSFPPLHCAGGVGASKEGQGSPAAPPRWAPVQPPRMPFASWARTGGFSTQLLFGFMHCYAHISAALLLMLLLELGVETCIRCGCVWGGNIGAGLGWSGWFWS